MLTEVMESNGHNPFALDEIANSGDGRVMFYRGELFLTEEELAKVAEVLSRADTPVGRVQLTEVKTPPLIPAIYPTTAPIVPSLTSLPPRSNRGSITGALSSTGNGKAFSERTQERGNNLPSELKRERVSSASGEGMQAPPLSAPQRSGGKAVPKQETHTLPTVKSDRSKIQSIIREAYISISADPDYRCLEATYIPEGLVPPVTMTSIRNRIEAESYDDHFQFMGDLVVMSSYWLQGPPLPNPLLPQYMAALKLSRNGTDVLMNSVGEISNEDYYEGPDVDAIIKIETKRESAVEQRQSVRPPAASPSYARKVRRTESSSGGGALSKTSELKQIHDQVNLLTEHVLGMQKNVKSSRASESAHTSETNARALNAEEIRKLETDLMKLSPEDIDHIVSNILKDEPSVRVDDESYELDVAALPPTKQRNLRRFVSRKLNNKDPAFGAHKLKQLLRDDERAKASEEFAERLLAAGPVPAAAPPVQPRMSPEEEEAERQRQLREQQREEEAKRLWRLANGDDEEMND